ncbi:gliding motility-associated C-terminal domain-containing protein [Maribacter sp. R86514]|uniref:T9SS type B sorting domain-containing protein n=1 Tax=Maribacter sp. R86514 TaxID=3093854 RepID=UPI0037CA95EB
MIKFLPTIAFLFLSISLSAQLDLTLAQSESICSSDGSITATANGGTQPYQYSIVSGPETRGFQSAETFLALQPGNYSVEVRDATFATVSANITVTGNYVLPNLNVNITNPSCSGSSNGQVILTGSNGNHIATSAFPTYKYRIVDLSTSPQTVLQEQNSDTFTGLSEGTYTFQIKDDCQNTVSETITLTAPSITSLNSAINFIEKAACDTYEVEYAPFGRGVSPHQITVTDDATGTVIFSSSIDTSNGVSYSLGTNYNFGNGYTANIVDACGQTETKNFTYTPDIDMWSQKAFDCSGETAFFVFASLTNSSSQEKSILVPATLTLTNQADASDVLVYTFTDPNDLEAEIREADIQLGSTYDAILQDSCSYTMNTALTFTPVPVTTFEANVRPERGCMDGTTGMGFHVRNGGTNYGRVTILSGPASFTSESGVVTNYSYPRVFVNPNGSSVYPEAFPPGIYEAEITDGCETGIETFEILPSQTVQHDFSLDFLQGCGNSNSLIINPNVISNINNTFYTNVTITNLDTGNSVFRESIFFFTEGTPVTVPNLPAGNYQLNLEFQSGGECTSGRAFTCACEPQTRNITIPTYVSTSFDNIVGYLCTEGSGVIFAEGSNGIAPYQYEIIDSSVPSNIGRTSTDGIFTATDEGTYTVRISDSCGNSADGAFEVVPYLPNLVANCQSSGTRVTLTANPVTNAIFTWIDDSGNMVQQGTSNELVFDPFDASQGGEYTLQVEAPGLNCTIFDGNITVPDIPCSSNIDVSKTVETGPIYNSTTNEYTVTYRITAENTGGLSGSYDVIDTFILGDGFSLVNATLAYGNETDGVDGTIISPFVSGNQIITGESIAGLRSESWLVTALFTLDKNLYDPTQNCTNGGGLGNQITVTGDSDTSNNIACVTVDFGNLEITKDGVYVDTDANGLANIGDEVDYTFIITNTGNVPISNLVVSDPLLGGTIAGPAFGDTDSDGQLDTTEIWSYTATYSISQTDIDNGQVNNLATVTGEDTSGNIITNTSTDPTPCTTCTPPPSCTDCTLTELPGNPSYAINDSSTTEGNDNVFTITASNSIDQDIVFNLTYINNTTTNTDYSGSNTITLLANTSSVTFNVAAFDDNLIERTETHEVQISYTSGGSVNITDDIGIGEILDNDADPTLNSVQFDTTSITVNEDAGTVTLNVVLNADVQDEFTVEFYTVDGSATNASDYTGVPRNSQTLTFGGTNSNTQPIVIPIIDDILIEEPETFNIILENISSPIVGILSDNIATVTIIDNDGDEGWPTDITIEACDEIPDAFVITSDSDCAITVDYTELVEGQDDECATEYTITRTWTITDCVGNVRTHAQVITIEDTVAPTFNETLTQDMTVECNMVPDASTLTATDSCEPNIDVVFEETITNDENCALGYTVTRTWTAADCAGNMVEHTQVITVEPIEPITSLTYEEEITIICGDDIPEAPEMVFTGGCGDFDVIYNEETQQADDSDDYMIIRTWNVTDSCGNTADFEQIVFVLQPQLQEITINICIEEEPIDLLNYLPEDFDSNGTFMILEGDVVLEGNYFDPMDHEPGEYKITYSSTEGTCKYYVDFTVIVDTQCVPCGRVDIEISKAVTANGDGVNDFFEITVTENCALSFDVMIFNRWGVLIFEMKDYQNDWGGESPNGSFGSSEILPTGTYYYIIMATNKSTDTELEPFSGYIYLAT